MLDSLADSQPRVVFVSYAETDAWSHPARHDRDQTTFIITTDHGRGSGTEEWKEHGVEQKGSENIWLAVMGPDTAALRAPHHPAEIHHAQIAATVAALLGKDYRQAVPAAAAPITEVLGTGP